MSHSTSPTNRGLLFGWVKNLKKGNLLSNDSINEVYDPDSNQESANSTSTAPNANNSGTFGNPSGHAVPGSGPGTTNTPGTQSQHGSFSSNQAVPLSNQEFLRPNTPSRQRSLNNVIRVRSNSFNQSEQLLRQHRDSFLQHNPLVDQGSAYFGVPLEDAIKQASAKIHISGGESEAIQYGHIPLVVAKCAIFIKSNGLSVEGIFRVGGSSKRLKELQNIFNTPPEFGKKLDWEGYTVHDALSMLRRYLNALPEPLIPLEFYDEFREPLMERQRIIKYLKFRAENPKSHKKSEVVENGNVPISAVPEDTSLASVSQPGDLSKEAAEAAKILREQSKDLTKFSTDEKKRFDISEPLTEANIDRFNHTKDTNKETTENKKFTVVKDTDEGTPVVKVQQARTPEEKKARKARTYKNLTKEVHEAIELYKIKVDKLPALSKQLLFYILDLLSMVQEKSELNRMSSRNLAAIFQPLILSHPNHDLDPDEYILSQAVVEFLIQYSYKLLPERGGPNSSSTTEETQPEVEMKPVEATKKTQEEIRLTQSPDLLNVGPKNVDLENDLNSDFELSDDNFSNVNKSNLTLDSTYKTDGKNIDGVFDNKAGVTLQDLSIGDRTDSTIKGEYLTGNNERKTNNDDNNETGPVTGLTTAAEVAIVVEGASTN